MTVLDDIRENYPTLAFLVNDPEVGQLLKDAVDPNKGFSPQAFQAKLYQTNWYKTRSEAVRTNDILRNTDPGEWKARLSEYGAQVKAMSDQLGLNLSPAEISYISGNNLRYGIEANSPEARASLATFAKKAVTSSSFMAPGTIMAATQNVKAMAAGQYFLPMDENIAKQWAVDLAFGVKDEAALKAELQKSAASRYTWLAPQLNAGQSMEQIFAGHRAVIAEELEIDPGSIDFTRGDWRRVLGVPNEQGTTNDTAGPQAGNPGPLAQRPMTLYEAQTLARQDTRWWSTSRGRSADAGMANFMLKSFGARG